MKRRDPLRDDFVLVADPDFSMEPGVRSVRSLGRVLFLYDEALQRFSPELDESTALGKMAGVVGRLLKLGLIDVPLASLESTAVHEVFRHGARARENGQTPSFQFSLPYPYRWLLDREAEYGGAAFNGRANNLERDLAFIAGGIESDHFLAWYLMNEFIMPRGEAHYSEAILYLRSKASYAATAFFDIDEDQPDNLSDPHNYMTALQQRFNRWRPEERGRIERRLQIAWLWIFSDPMLWLSLYEVLVEHAYFGERWMTIPRLAVAEYRIFPATRFDLSPFGAEHYVDLYVTRG